jgi:hypothetical protein
VTTPRKLTIYGAVLAVVFAVSLVVGSAASPTGLSDAEPESEDHGGEMAGPMVRGLAAAEGDLRLEAATDTIAAGHRVAYRFRITDDEGVRTRFDIEHTKRMHLIVVRRDFTGFQHLHPTMRPGGTWTVPLTIGRPGAYRVFADFSADETKYTLATDLFVPGDFQPVAVPPVRRVAAAGEGYTAQLSGRPVAGDESRLGFVVRQDGRRVTNLQPYLGALGHLVALRDGDLAYLHVHPDEHSLTFDAEFPTPGTYRLFLQFRHDVEVRTAAFTVVIAEESR